jgi:hypothetical protein
MSFGSSKGTEVNPKTASDITGSFYFWENPYPILPVI